MTIEPPAPNRKAKMPDTQISEEMVERAARALFPSDFNDRHGDNCLDCKEARDEARTKARAALEAALSGHVVVPEMEG